MSLWAILSLVPGLSHLFLGGYVLYRNPKKLLNIIFSLLALSLAIWGLSEFAHRLTSSVEVARLWIRVSAFGWCFMASLSVHFVLVLAKQEKILKNKLTYMGLYGPSSVILYLSLTTDLIFKQEPRKAYFGYASLPGELIWIYVLYYVILYIFIVHFLLKVIREGSLPEKKQSRPILFGTTTFLLLTTATNVVCPKFGVSTPELGTTFSMILALSIFYAVIKHKLFIIEPLFEGLTETPEKYPLEKGIIYLVGEETPDKGYEIFYDRITHGEFGLCITKFAPEKVRERYRIAKTPILWLTFSNMEGTLSPKDTDGLILAVSDFVRKVEKSLILIDCFDQIMFANGFKKALPLLKDLKILCSENNSTMLILIDPAMFDSDQLSAIKAEMEG